MTHLNSAAGADRHRPRLARAVVAATAVAGAALSILAGTPAASAATATSPGRLQLGISVPEPVLAGVASTYRITVTNTGTTPVAGIQIMDFLPAGLTLGSLLNPDVCARTNKPVIPNTAFNCNAGTLQPAAHTSVAFTATAAQPFRLTDVAQTLGSVAGTTVTNSVALPVLVRPGPTDIQVSGAASTGSPTAGSAYTYTFQVRDSGPQTAYGVTLTDALPPSSVLVAAGTDAGICQSSLTVVRCSLGALATGRQVTVTITVTAPATPQTLSDIATVTMIGPDTRPANNQAVVTVASR